LVEVDAFRLPSQAEQATLRRKQLIAVVAHLVVTRGIAEVTHASVAEVAGCARSLVYRYFPRREDLLFGVLSAFEDELNELFEDPRETVDGILALKDARPGYVPPATQTFHEKLWGPHAWDRSELGFRLACVILMRDSSLRAVVGEHDTELERTMRERLLDPLESLGLTSVESWIVVDSMLSVMHHATSAVWDGTMEPDEASELITQVPARTLQTFTNRDRGALSPR
jgi:AcrR family transcriptional regulator